MKFPKSYRKEENINVNPIKSFQVIARKLIYMRCDVNVIESCQEDVARKIISNMKGKLR